MISNISRLEVYFFAETTEGVSPVGWVKEPEITLIDVALDEYDRAWAASGHPHSVYPTSFAELLRIFGGRPMEIGSN